MAKELDNMKMWAAFLASLSKQTVGEYINSTNLYIDLCSELKRQGFGYKDGGIMPIDGKPELSHSELGGFEYTIPQGYEAEIKDGKVIVRKTESEDEKIRKELIDYLKERKSCESYGQYVVRYDRWIAWLEKQKHEEWSLYDEKILSEVFTSVETDAYSEEKKKEIISWLQKYRPYMHEKRDEQNPAWSEEDEYYCNIILYILNNECVGKTDKENAVNWFKSLKERIGNFDDGYKVGFSAAKHNQWKPSDGQIECLSYAIEKAEKDWFPLTNNRVYITLKALEEQLKKLREE